MDIPFKTSDGFDLSGRDVDPELIRKILEAQFQAGYTSPEWRNWGVATAGAESNFGTRAYGKGNPLSYKWPSKLFEIDAMKDVSADRRKSTRPYSGLIESEDSIYDQPINLQDQQVVNVKRAFDLLQDKQRIARSKGIQWNPQNAAWLWQGTGTPNRAEVPSGRAYGQVVQQTSPGTGHSKRVMEAMEMLKSHRGYQQILQEVLRKYGIGN